MSLTLPLILVNLYHNKNILTNLIYTDVKLLFKPNCGTREVNKYIVDHLSKQNETRLALQLVGQFLTCNLSPQASSWCFCSNEFGKGL